MESRVVTLSHEVEAFFELHTDVQRRERLGLVRVRDRQWRGTAPVWEQVASELRSYLDGDCSDALYPPLVRAAQQALWRIEAAGAISTAEVCREA